MKKPLVPGFFVFAASLASSAAVFDVSVDTSSGTYRIPLSATAHIATEPSDLPAPVFHFDATRTNGWTFNASGTEVSKIPSLTGSRYLARSLGDGDSRQLYNGTINAAVWMPSVPELGGLPALDLGAKDSGRALFFDPVANGGTVDSDYEPVNLMKNIGTVVAVHRPLPTASMSFLGGGFIKGSPQGPADTVSYGNTWYRDLSSKLAERYWQPVFYGYRGPLGGSAMYHNGLKTDPTLAGFTGEWEISVFQPKEAKWQASGIGLNFVPSKAYERGGSQWAELYVFDRVVDEAVLERLNAYLLAKWFGNVKRDGYNGYSSVGRVCVLHSGWTQNGGTNVVSVGEGETLKIDELAGGRGHGSAFEKEGEGTLKILDAAHFGGDIVLKGGKLDLSVRETPDLENLPAGLSYRFDASDVGTMALEEENGVEYLRRWKNATENTVKAGTVIYARTAGDNAAKRPWLVRNALGPGLHTLDFGEYNTANTTDPERYAARCLDFVYTADNATYTAFNPQSVYTIVAVMGAQRSGGNIVSGSGNEHVFSRHETMVDWMKESDFTAQILREKAVDVGYLPIYPITNSCVMIDGVVVNPNKGYRTPGFQVVAIKTSAQSIKFIGGTSVRQGGLNLSELLVYQRPLEEEEIRDVQAYLAKKWFNRDLEGYSSQGNVLPRARSIVAEGASEICVPAGQTVRVESLTANAVVLKTGGGTLEVGPFSNGGSSSVKIADGAVKPVAAIGVAEGNASPAAGASLHLDAADPKSVYFVPGSETGAVWCWYDKSHRNTAYMMTAANQPVYSANGATLNGIPVMDCCPDSTPRGLCLARPLNGVRAAFVVWHPFDGGSILGSCSKGGGNNYSIDFVRHSNTKSLILENTSTLPVRNGSIYADGKLVTVAAQNYVPAEGFQITELYPASGTHVSAIAQDRSTVTGAARFAEIILYERELSEREKVATRNYLAAKWFPGRELQPLPEEDDVVFKGSLVYGDGSVFSVSVGEGEVCEKVAISGTLGFEAGVSFAITGFSNVNDPACAQLAIANASGYRGLENLENARVFADGVELAGSARPLFKVSAGNNDLVMKFCPRGLLLEIR